MENLQQILNRLAIEHLNRQTLTYIQKLEAVASSAKLVISGNTEAIRATHRLRQRTTKN